jgi:DNA-binding transcriptional ArsR family regulator
MTETENEGKEPDGVWVSIAELARLKGISRQSATERVDRLERLGHIETRRDGRSRLVELVSFDLAVGQAGDAARELVAETRKASPVAREALRDAQSDRARYDAKLKALELAERTRNVVAVRGPHGLEAALITVSEKMMRELGAPLNWTADIMSAASEGEGGIRRVLKKKLREQRERIALVLLELASVGTEAERAGIDIDLNLEDESENYD